MKYLFLLSVILLNSLFVGSAYSAALRGTGDLGLVIERADSSVLIVEHSHNQILKRITGLGDLSHASVVFSRDARFAFIFGRDGGLSKIDLLAQKIVKRIIQSGNSIGGAISQNGQLIAVSNYTPGGVRIFDTETLALVADIPADYGAGKNSKVIGLVDVPENKFLFSLYDAGEIWLADMNQLGKQTGNSVKKQAGQPQITKYKNIGRLPYDGLITGDGRHYVAGLFGEDGLAHLDLWHLENGVKKIMPDYGRGQKKLPVYKMPHLEGWAVAGSQAFFPAVGQHQVIVANTKTWRQTAAIDVIGQPVFVMAEPTGRKIWVNFAFPDNQWVQVIDVETHQIIKTLRPGKGVLHMEFTPRGEAVWISVRDQNQLQIYDTQQMSLIKQLTAKKPSGIFFTSRAHRIGL